jgi:hypothetical protein
MAGAGYKSFTAGAVLGATEVNTYLMQQAVMVFATTTARDTTTATKIASPTSGMLTYITATKTLELYDGSGWTIIGGGDYTTYPNQPVLTSGGISRIQPFAIEQGTISITGNGAVTLTSGRFTASPAVYVTVQSSTSAVTSATVSTPSTSGFTIYSWVGATAGAVARTVTWVAIQMKSGGLSG